jgi:DNA-binding beta-propeller fold protein YncE
MLRSHPARAAFGLPLAALFFLLLGNGLLRSRPSVPTAQTFPLAALPTALAVDAASQRAFVLTDDGSLNIFDLAHPHMLRALHLPGPSSPSSTLALDSRTHRLFVADPVAGSVYVLDSRSGALLTTVSVGQGTIALAVDAHHGHVFVANAGDGNVSMLDGRRGALLRTTAVGLAATALSLDPRAGRIFAGGWGQMPNASGGSDVGQAGVLDSRSGTLVRTIPLGPGLMALAAVPSTGRIFVACASDSTVRVFDTRRGALLRAVRVGAAPWSMAVDEPAGRVFVATAGDHSLSTLDARTGRLLHTTRLDGGSNPLATDPYAMAVDAARDRLYVAQWGRLDVSGHFESRGTLSILEARTGALLRRIAVGVTPQAMAVDETSGRLVVASGGGEVRRPADVWPALGLGWLRSWLPWLGHLVPRPPAADWVPSSVSVIETGA